jgi:hypothetical protein
MQPWEPAPGPMFGSWRLAGVRGEPAWPEPPAAPSPEFPPEAVVASQLEALRWAGRGAGAAGLPLAPGCRPTAGRQLRRRGRKRRR